MVAGINYKNIVALSLLAGIGSVAASATGERRRREDEPAAPQPGHDDAAVIVGAGNPAPIETVLPRARSMPRPWPAFDPRAVKAVAEADAKRARKNARRSNTTKHNLSE